MERRVRRRNGTEEDLVLRVESRHRRLGRRHRSLDPPPEDIDLLFDIISCCFVQHSTPLIGLLRGSLKTLGANDSKTILIGSNTGSRLEFSSVSTKAGVRVDSTRDIDTYIEFELKDGGIIIKAADDADSFLSSLLPRDGLSTQFTLQLGFSTRQGLYFGGRQRTRGKSPGPR